MPLNLRGITLPYTFLEKRKCEVSEGTTKSLLMKIQVFRSPKVKSISFTAQSNSFEQLHNVTVRRMVL